MAQRSASVRAPPNCDSFPCLHVNSDPWCKAKTEKFNAFRQDQRKTKEEEEERITEAYVRWQREGMTDNLSPTCAWASYERFALTAYTVLLNMNPIKTCVLYSTTPQAFICRSILPPSLTSAHLMTHHCYYFPWLHEKEPQNETLQV